MNRLTSTQRMAIWFAATRGLALAMMACGAYFPNLKNEGWHQDQGHFYKYSPYRALDVWGRWDTMFYDSIAREGYPAAHSDGSWVYHAAYYPMYPSMMRGLSELTGLAPFYCGVFLSNLALLGALIYLFRLVELDDGPAFAEKVVLCVLAYPGSHFLSCVYPDSMAFFLGVFACYCARKNLVLPTLLACALAAVTRSSGIFICLPVAYEWARSETGFRLAWRHLGFAFVALPVVAWLALNFQLYHDPIYFMHVQAGWGRHISFPFEPLFHFDVSPDHHLFAVLGLLAMGYGIYRRERLGYQALAVSGVVLPLLTGLVRGVHRYMASNFPLYIFAARYFSGHPRLWRVYQVVGVVVMAVFAFQWGKERFPN